MEIWKDIKGYEGLYQVSSEGRIKSIKRRNRKKDKILKLECRARHYGACLYKKNIPKYWGVHRLVAGAFIPNIQNKPFVCHKDGIPKNNNIDNVYWGTSSENAFDAVRHGTHPGLLNKGENGGQAKLKEVEVIKIKKLYATDNYSQYELGRMFNISRSSIEDIICGRTWKHLIKVTKP